jgi:hypothetical protein
MNSSYDLAISFLRLLEGFQAALVLSFALPFANPQSDSNWHHTPAYYYTNYHLISTPFATINNYRHLIIHLQLFLCWEELRTDGVSPTDL